MSAPDVGKRSCADLPQPHPHKNALTEKDYKIVRDCERVLFLYLFLGTQSLSCSVLLLCILSSDDSFSLNHLCLSCGYVNSFSLCFILFFIIIIYELIHSFVHVELFVYSGIYSSKCIFCPLSIYIFPLHMFLHKYSYPSSH